MDARWEVYKYLGQVIAYVTILDPKGEAQISKLSGTAELTEDSDYIYADDYASVSPNGASSAQLEFVLHHDIMCGNQYYVAFNIYVELSNGSVNGGNRSIFSVPVSC